MKSHDKRKPTKKQEVRHRKRTKASLPLQASVMTDPQAALIVGVGIAFSLGIISQWEPLNGVREWTDWEWPWRDLGVFTTALRMFAPLAAISWVLWRVERTESFRPWGWLAVLALSNYALQVLGMLSDPRGMEFVRTIVVSPGTTSYFRDAKEIQGSLSSWLAQFPSLTQHWIKTALPLHLHSATHPPGPILYYYLFIKLFGAATGAMVGGCLVGLLGSAGVFVIYHFAALWGVDQKTRITASALYALVPALTIFFPEFDQVYPCLSMLLIMLWLGLLRNPQRWLLHAFGFGLVLFVSSFWAYNLFSIGVFPLYYAGYWVWTERFQRSALWALARACCIIVVTFGGAYILLWLLTGYNALASFLTALGNQSELTKLMERPYPSSIMDPYDFLLGAGMMALPLIIFHVRKLFRAADVQQGSRALTFISLGTILTIAVSGLLRSETARVWLFLQPLLIVPAAIELSQARWLWRMRIFGVQWWVLVCLKAKMNFLDVR